MKKIISVALCLLMICAVCTSLVSCSGDGKKPLVVYTESGFAPFEYVDNGKIVGVDVDIMTLVAEKLGMTLQMENIEFDKIVDAVSDGTLTNVGAAGLSITEARKEKVDFSNEYYTAKLYVVYLNADAADYEAVTTDGVTGVYWDALKGKNIAVQNGTTADLFLGDELADGGVLYGTDAKKTGFSAYASALADVGLNCDVIIMDELPAQAIIKGKDQYRCAPLYYFGDGEADEAAVDVYAICVTKGKTELLDAINAVLKELGEDGIQKLVNKHLGIEG